MDTLRILFASAEVSPFAKVGGLADVAGSLPKALEKAGIDVRVVMPKYGIIDTSKFPLTKVADAISIPFRGNDETISLYQTQLPGSSVPVYLIEHEKFLGGDGVYPPSEIIDESERFSFFTRSVLEIFNALDWWPNVIHCHDWQTAMIPALVKIFGKSNQRFVHIKTLLTIHNLAMQGWTSWDEAASMFGISESDHVSFSQKDQSGSKINYLEQGILSADKLNTVSPTYAKEILTKEFGASLEEKLSSRTNDLIGILNGIDYDIFNPATDPLITAQFAQDSLDKKTENKLVLQKQGGLKEDANIPLIGLVSRLTDQKGIDFIAEIGDQFLSQDVQFILLGTGDKKVEALMSNLAKKHPRKMSAMIKFDKKLAMQIYAGADMFLMPSKFEPCGLGQMIAMKYGTVPIVRATGGLKDTVQQIDPNTGDGEGFVFQQSQSSELLVAIQNALSLYKDKKLWHTVVQHVMQNDFSWTQSAKEYIKLYEQLS
ncbi:glycogen synthase [Patescibacteria group bacterium]